MLPTTISCQENVPIWLVYLIATSESRLLERYCAWLLLLLMRVSTRRLIRVLVSCSQHTPLSRGVIELSNMTPCHNRNHGRGQKVSCGEQVRHRRSVKAPPLHRIGMSGNKPRTLHARAWAMTLVRDTPAKHAITDCRIRHWHSKRHRTRCVLNCGP